MNERVNGIRRRKACVWNFWVEKFHLKNACVLQTDLRESGARLLPVSLINSSHVFRDCSGMDGWSNTNDTCARISSLENGSLRQRVGD
jgi:hypothetical protein